MLAATAADLVHALKYEGWHELAEFMAGRMAAASSAVRGSAIVTPVPTTAARQRRRGYNQAALLARGVASALDLPFLALLARSVDRRSQIELEPSQRRANVRDVFAPAPGIAAVRDLHVLLVDDVLTTGATASEASTVLARHGARTVHLLTFTRALPESVSALS